MLVCRLSGYDEKFQRDCGLVTREQMEHWGIEEEVLFRMHGQICLQNVRQYLWILRMPTSITMTRISLPWRKNRRESGGRMQTLCPYQQHGSWGGVHDGRGNDAEVSRKAGWKSDRPSGIHPRCDLMVEREGLDMERLRNGVYGANRAFPDADYLSDEIYRYDRDTHRLSVIPGACVKSRP